MPAHEALASHVVGDGDIPGGIEVDADVAPRRRIQEQVIAWSLD